MVVTFASLAALDVASSDFVATAAGYYERCGDARGATQVRHHDEDCRTTKRIAEAYSRDNPDPEHWSCASRGRGITAVVHSAPEAVVTCSKKPGDAVRLIRFQISACPGADMTAAGSRGSSRRTDDWPGVPGHTTIVASVASAAEARRVQDAVCDRGLAAGVLYSSNYRSLRRGFWVVFSGTSRTRQEASLRTSQVRSRGYRNAYTRFVR